MKHYNKMRINYFESFLSLNNTILIIIIITMISITKTTKKNIQNKIKENSYLKMKFIKHV